jgi:AcrR family transcriptional regulator
VDERLCCTTQRREGSAVVKIAALERESGVSRSTIHHYLNLGLLPPPEVRGPRLHHFEAAHLKRLVRIQELRARGWSLPRIRTHLNKPPARPRVRAKAPGVESGLRSEILERATRLFAERGYHEVRLSDVAVALGIGKATIYRHFESKQELFVSCVERMRYFLVPPEVRAASGTAGFGTQGRGRAMAVLHHFAAYRTFTHLLGALSHGMDVALATRARAELHAMITNAEPYLKMLMAAKLIRQCDTELLAYMTWGALIGAGERLTMDSKYSMEEVLDAYLAFASLGASGLAPKRP